MVPFHDFTTTFTTIKITEEMVLGDNTEEQTLQSMKKSELEKLIMVMIPTTLEGGLG